MIIDEYRLPILIAGLATTGIGVALWRFRFPAKGSSVLGALLMLKGMVLMTAGLLPSVPIASVGLLLHFQHILLLPIVLLVAYLLFINNSQSVGRQKVATWGLVSAVAALEVAYVLKPGLVHELQQSTGEGLARAGPGWVYVSYGPLVWLLALGSFALAILSIVFVRHATRGDPRSRTVAYWLALGFIVNGVFDGGMAIAYLIHDPAIGGVSGLGWILGVSRALALLPAGIALGILVGTELAKPHPQRWRWALPAVLALAAWFSGPMPVIFGAADYGQTWPTAVATGLWRAALPILAGIGLWQLHVASKARAPAPAGAVRPRAEEA